MILDVGCGSCPRGDVNIDAFPFDRKQCHEEWNPKDVENFVLSHGCYLPFKDNVFDRVVSIGVLEHIHAPLRLLREMKRVCCGKIYLEVPSQFNLGDSETHFYTWNPLTLKNLLKLVFDSVECGYKKGLLLGGKSKKYLPILNILLSKLNFQRRLYAICE